MIPILIQRYVPVGNVCSRLRLFIVDPSMDGKNQWGMISEGQKSARTEFVYNIDQLANCSAIRYVGLF